jgi:Secretion system C-terminal sorting domain
VHGVSVYALSLTYAVIEIYKGNCNNPSLIFCSTDLPYSSYYGAKLDGLTIGNTYFIRIYSLSSLTSEEGIFSVCVTTPYSLANDPCEGAIDLPVNPSADCVQSTKGNNYDACASVFPSCIGYADDDVWYKFTALSDSHIIRVDSTTVFDLVVQLFKGTCNALIPSKCIDNTTSGAEQATVSGLIPGSVYYLRIHSKKFAYWNRGKFRICITTPLQNDNCTTPTPLTVSPTCANPLVQNSSTATPYALLPHCAGEPDDDLWYTFVATAPTQSIVIGASPNDYTAVIEVFKGNCLGTFVGCKANTLGDTIFTYTLNALITGTKYYVRVFKKDIGGGAFSICVIGATSGTENGVLSSGQINIYPNPVNDLLTIEVEKNIEVNYITLLDMHTRVCIHQDTPENTTQLDLSGLPSGIYIVQIQTAQGFYFSKVVKE